MASCPQEAKDKPLAFTSFLAQDIFLENKQISALNKPRW